MAIEPPKNAEDSSTVVVLHVEDDAAVANSVRLLLKTCGYQTRTFTNAADAEGSVTDAGLRPDVLIVDYRLGEGETGTDVAERIAETLGYPLPTIVLTGNLSNAEVPWMPGAPIMMASKPMDGAQLIETVQSFSALHRLAQARRAARAHS
jgi:FixJ family two-component response regulator